MLKILDGFALVGSSDVLAFKVRGFACNFES